MQIGWAMCSYVKGVPYFADIVDSEIEGSIL